MLRALREFLQWRKGDSIILAEANVLPQTDMQYFGEAGDRMQMMFNFQVNQNLFYALAAADTRPLVKAMKATKPRPATAQWGIFLRNHDELDLGRLTDEQRQAVFDAFGPDRDMQLYDRGIRRRLAPMLGGDRRRLELAYSLMFTLPGTPVLRYGDELGMGDNLDLARAQLLRARRCNGRPSRTAGFTKSNKPVVPVISERSVRLRACQCRRCSGAIRIRCSTGPSASSACARRCPRSAGAISRCIDSRRRRRARHALRLAQQFGAVRAQSRPRKPREVDILGRASKGECGRICWSICSTRGPQPCRRATAGTACCSRPTAIAGTGSAGSTICSSAANIDASSLQR